MGKARILEEHGEGRYTIEIIESRERAELAKEEATRRVSNLRSEVLSMQQKLGSLQAVVDSAVLAQNIGIAQYRQEREEGVPITVDLDKLAEDLLKAASARDKVALEIKVKELRIKSDEALIARVDSLPALRQIQAWCADYTEDLSGEVSTAEVPGEIGEVIIKPGFEGNTWDASTDGAIQPSLAGTPASVFYNLAMMPGWQKWRPLFRTATISSLDNDTCSIVMDAAISSQQGLGVNAQTSHDNVPILYMDCNGDAFEEGDQVLVAFAGNVSGPTVVGFAHTPKMCTGAKYITISLQDWPKPNVNYHVDNYEDWMTPQSLGVPISSGGYQLTKEISEDQIEVNATISHSDSFVQVGSNITIIDGKEYGTMTYTYSVSHSCNVAGTIDHFGKKLDVSLAATINGGTQYSVGGLEIADAKTDWEFTLGANVGYIGYHDPRPFLPVGEVFTIGSQTIDVEKISEHLFNDTEHSKYADWIRYYPGKSLDHSMDRNLFLRGVTRPYSILFPDIVSFKTKEAEGVLVVFSSTGPITTAYSAGYLAYFEVDFEDEIRWNTPSRLRYHEPGSGYSSSRNYALGGGKLHFYMTLLGSNSSMVRGATPPDVLNFYKQNKVRGAGSDIFYEAPLDVSFSSNGL